MNHKIREIIVLSKINNEENYYVMGIDVNTKKLVRLISDDKKIDYSIRPIDFVNKYQEESKILDKIVVQLKDKKEENLLSHQIENMVIDTNYYVCNKGVCNEEELNTYLDVCSNKKEHILFNSDKRIMVDKLLQLEEKHSLELVCIEEVDVRIKDFEDGTLTADILFNGIWYKDLAIKDEEFREKYYIQILDSTKGYITLRNQYLLMGFSDCVYGHYYKVIKKIIEF